MSVSSSAVADYLDPANECQPQRVLVVDENELMQAGLKAVFLDAPWVAACYVAGDAELAVHIIRRRQPQLVLVSASLGGKSGPDLCHWLKENMPHIKVAVMSGAGRVPAAFAASLGAVAVLSKHMPRGVILAAMKRVADGERVLPRRNAPSQLHLSKRELDVLHHVAAGLSNRETASTLNLSQHTVKQYTSALYRKLNVRNRAEAASRAQQLGLLFWNLADAGQRTG